MVSSKNSKAKGGSTTPTKNAIVDLTSFGFSRGKRPAPTPPSAASVAPAPPTLSSSDDDNEDSSLKVMSTRDLPRTSSPPARLSLLNKNHDESHQQYPAGGDGKKSSSAGGSTSSSTRAALLDLTQPESTAAAAAATTAPPCPKLDTLADMGMTCVETILGGGGGGGGQQRRGKRERFNNDGTNDGDDSRGGKRQVISIFEDPPSLSATTAGKEKIHAKKHNSSNSPSPKKPLVRDGSIQSYFSAASPTLLVLDKANNGTLSSSSLPKSGIPTTTSPSGSKVVVTHHHPHNVIDNLALLRVTDPHQIACTIAVKRAKDSATLYDELDHVPHVVYPNAYLGRSSSSRNNNHQSNFVDIDIPSTTMGISRRHLDIVEVTGLRSSSAGDDTTALFSHSSSSSRQATARSLSSSSSSSAASTGSSSMSGNKNYHPEMIVKVYEKASNGIHIYRTRRGERKDTYIPQGQQISLRIGDAIQFYSKPVYPYCVVGLVTNHNTEEEEEEIVEIVDTDDDDNEGCGKKKSMMDVAPSILQDENMATRRNNESLAVAKVVSKSMVNNNSALTFALAVPSQDTISILKSNNIDIPNDEDKVYQTLPTVVGESKMYNNNHGIESLVKTQVPLFQVGTVVSVQDRTWPGRNDVGGVARIIKVQSNNDDGVIIYDVKYILESRREKCVEEQYIIIHNPDVNMGGSPRKRIITMFNTNKDDDNDTNKDDENAPVIGKGDYVKILFETTDMFGDVQQEWYCGDVKNVTKTQQTCKIRVQFLDTTFDTFDYPSSDVKKLDTSIESSTFYPEVFAIGDIVDANFQDGGEKSKWFRGRVAFVDEEAGTCDVMYYDGEYESSIPMNEKKIRFARRDSSGGWLVEKIARLSRDNEDRYFKTGQVTKLSTGDYQIMFDDKSKEVVGYDEVVKAVFDNLRMKLPLSKQHVWPVSNLRRLRRDQKTVMKESILPITKVKVEPTAIRSNIARSSKYVTIKAEPVDEMVDALDFMDSSSWIDSNDVDISHLYIPLQSGSAVESSILEARKVAKEFPPGLPNMLWCGLNSSEAQTVSNFLWDLLCVHDSVPPTTMILKLMDLMKYGPKAEGSSVYFKDQHRTELVSYYVFGLLSASNRLVRRDTGALFGPSTWNDIEVLLTQSLIETENMISGRRLAHGLHLAARGAMLLSTMLLTELSGHDLFSTSNVVLDPTALKDMPTVRLIKSNGVRTALKFAVEQMTKCLVRHSRWIMDSGGIELATNKSTSDESCCLESRVCLDNVASVVCVIAWLFCVEEKCDLKDPSVAFVIKDSLLVEIERSLEDLPQMSKQIRVKFIKKCKMYFFMSFVDGFSIPLKLTLVKMIGVD